jgi:phage gp37-like protein
MLNEIEEKIVEKLKADNLGFKTVKEYEGESFSAEDIREFASKAPFAFVVYLGRSPESLGNERRTLFKYRIFVGEKSYKKEKSRKRALKKLKSTESSITSLELSEYCMEAFRLTKEGLMYTDKQFSIYYQDFTAFKYNC